MTLKQNRELIQYHQILAVLQTAKTKAKAAKKLGISRKTLYNRLNKISKN